MLRNVSMQDGVISASAAPGTIWQVVYEDSGAQLSGSIAQDETVPDSGGAAIKVSTNHCLWHWLVLALALLGTVLEWMLRKKRRAALILLAVDGALMLLAAILGWCGWDFPVFAAGLILTAGSCFLSRKHRGADSDI